MYVCRFGKRKKEECVLKRKSSENKKEKYWSMCLSFSLHLFQSIERRRGKPRLKYSSSSSSLFVWWFCLLTKEKCWREEEKKMEQNSLIWLLVSFPSINSSLFENVVHSSFAILYNTDKIPLYRNPRNKNPKHKNRIIINPRNSSYFNSKCCSHFRSKNRQRTRHTHCNPTRFLHSPS